MSDNYHQAVMGGTGANHIMLGSGDAIWFSDGAGAPEVPPNYPVNPTDPGTPVPGHASALTEVENPNPMPETNNFYTQDGYGGGSDPRLRLPLMPITGAVLTSIAPTPRSRRRRSHQLSRRAEAQHQAQLRDRATTISSTTTIPDISATAATLTRIPIPVITSLRSRLRMCATSATSFRSNKSPGRTSGINSIAISKIPMIEPGRRILQHLQLGAV